MKLIAPIRNLARNEEGSSMIELALLLPTFVLLLLGAIDLSRAYYLSMEVVGAAHAGAEYGITNRTDTAGITKAVTSDAPEVPNLSAGTPSWGCECSDGSSSSTSCTATPTCTYNTVYWVKVTASTTYHPVFPWPGIPSSMSIANTATLRTSN